LNPGTYVGGLTLFGNSAVTLMPGVYVMKGGGFTVGGTESVFGSGVVIINIPKGPFDTINVSASGSLSLSAPASGPYKGVALFQDPASSNPISFSAYASATIDGVVYAPKARVNITLRAEVTINPGPGTATLPPIFAAMIANDLTVSGNGELEINPDGAPP